jgi:dual specificity tyrosine-phosphorylation-regulated kinase 2/3/4
MEICGIPNPTVIDKSRKKDHYFDVDYSPFLIEDEEMGILRIPESRRLEDAVPCQDEQFLDFMRKCLDLDPEQRFSASEAIKHPWIQEGL